MKNYKVGQTLVWIADDFDGKTKVRCTVTEVHEDYAIASGNGMNLWIDSDTEEMFHRV